MASFDGNCKKGLPADLTEKEDIKDKIVYGRILRETVKALLNLDLMIAKPALNRVTLRKLKLQQEYLLEKRTWVGAMRKLDADPEVFYSRLLEAVAKSNYAGAMPRISSANAEVSGGNIIKNGHAEFAQLQTFIPQQMASMSLSSMEQSRSATGPSNNWTSAASEFWDGIAPSDIKNDKTNSPSGERNDLKESGKLNSAPSEPSDQVTEDLSDNWDYTPLDEWK